MLLIWTSDSRFVDNFEVAADVSIVDDRLTPRAPISILEKENFQSAFLNSGLATHKNKNMTWWQRLENTEKVLKY